MESLICSMRESAALSDRQGLAKVDTAFHHALIKASGNKALEKVWQTMRLAITTAITYTMSSRSLEELAERHTPVLDALRSRNPVLAEAAIRRHIDEAREWVMTTIEKEVPVGTGPATHEEAVG
jgi:DNA-binding FadR family transcriptional regulator